MDFGFSKEQELFRQQIRTSLTEEQIQAMLARLREDDNREPDARPLYRELGRRGLLAVNWPPEYGGAGRSLLDASIVVEEMVRAGVPDTLHVNTIQIVGLFLLMAGTPQQKASYLPPLARGERFASVLYTEPEAGSDLGSLATTAIGEGDGWRLSGVKIFSLKSHLTDLGLCAARTGSAGDRYQGISLFLVDLHGPGIRRSVITSIADEQFHCVELEGVPVAAGDLLGEEGNGWPLLSHALAVERTGLDYSLKAEVWLAAAIKALAAQTDPHAEPSDAMLEELGRHGASVSASRLLAWQVLTGLAQDRLDEATAAVSKFYSSELAQRIALWAATRLAGDGSEHAAILESAFREAPGLTISAGTSEMMLSIVASLALDGLESEARQS